jgi:hypothetical protein
VSIAYYAATISEFHGENPEAILGKLTRQHRHALEAEQKFAWVRQIEFLQSQVPPSCKGVIYFEFVVPRMGKRADVVLLLDGCVLIMEFKVGAAHFERQAVEQAHDYALDLKNFHKGSHNLPIVPALIATEAEDRSDRVSFAHDGVSVPICVGRTGLTGLVASLNEWQGAGRMDRDTWEGSGYQPTPTIIEAAQVLYRDHNVAEISRSDAGAKNLRSTSERISKVIEQSKKNRKKSICFITGVPGAGKTLAGLNIATQRATAHEDEHAVFLSGNGPLVDVLREALSRDQSSRERIKKSDAERKVRSFVQNIHHFRDEYLHDLNAPTEKVVVFDEAQRAWTREQASAFMQRKRGQDGFSQSEPEFLVSVMDRHTDWCTIVCLIGGGQEINTGEAGIAEWLHALQSHFPHWEVHASSLLEDTQYTADPEARRLLAAPSVIKEPDLHLSVSMRSFRAEALSGFVAATLDGDAPAAAALIQLVLPRYPLFLSRDLMATRRWLRHVARGSERFGLVASSGAHRLRAEGIHVKAAIDPSTWFLNDRSDVRSAYYLEEVATEFDVQGLELDWTGVCWDANLRYIQNGWQCHNFRGDRWQGVNAPERRLYLVNAYRVLLTRARQGMVIFVPLGDEQDSTRPPNFYDGTYSFLRKCGVPDLT